MAESSKAAPPNSCSGCGNTWTGVGPAHCAKCHQLFASVGLFDKHREATRATDDLGRCLNPASIRHNDQRIMFFREGMWRGPAVSEVERARMGWRKSSPKGGSDGQLSLF